MVNGWMVTGIQTKPNIFEKGLDSRSFTESMYRLLLFLSGLNILYLSGLNMMVPILNKEQKAMVGAKNKKPS